MTDTPSTPVDETVDTATAPNAGRPYHTDHLPDSDHVAPLVDVHAVDRLAEIPGALAALGALLDTLRANNAADVKVESTTITARAHLTPRQVQLKLQARQRQYDEGRKLYQEYLDALTGDDADAVRAANLAANYRHRWHMYLRFEGITEVAGHPTGNYDL